MVKVSCVFVVHSSRSLDMNVTSWVRSPYVDMRYAHSIRAFGVFTLTTLSLDLSREIGEEFGRAMGVSSVFVVHGCRSLDNECNVMDHPKK